MTRRQKSPEAKTNAPAPAKKEAQASKRRRAAATSPPKAADSQPGQRSKQSAAKSSGRMSALEAAARVLAETKKPMSCAELVVQMQTRGYWQSPAGKTPAATLYSAILRDLRNTPSRFQKTGRGRFACA